MDHPPCSSDAAKLVSGLVSRSLTLATAESCTGGLIAARLTDIPGASAVFLGGVVAYDNRVKREMLRVPAETLAAHGAVSAETAIAMAEGVRARTGADLAVSTTGIAGPGGATPGKPVGTVHIGLSGGNAPATATCFHFAGDRPEVRRQAVDAAIALLLDRLGAGA
ncbi:MAG: CinA family protein [Kiritimatiellia bacterium]|jgi:nicotinamide-nucleotide amidase